MDTTVEELVIKMISFGGDGKSLAFEAIEKAKKGLMDEAEMLLSRAEEAINQGRQAHLEVLAYEANHPDKNVVSLLFVHGADYVANGADICVIAGYLIDLYKERRK